MSWGEFIAQGVCHAAIPFPYKGFVFKATLSSFCKIIGKLIFSRVIWLFSPAIITQNYVLHFIHLNGINIASLITFFLPQIVL